jgi:hypothetical protein
MPKNYSLLGRVEGAEKAFLSGRRNREQDLESAVSFSWSFCAVSKASISTRNASRFLTRSVSAWAI